MPPRWRAWSPSCAEAGRPQSRGSPARSVSRSATHITQCSVARPVYQPNETKRTNAVVCLGYYARQRTKAQFFLTTRGTSTRHATVAAGAWAVRPPCPAGSAPALPNQSRLAQGLALKFSLAIPGANACQPMPTFSCHAHGSVQPCPSFAPPPILCLSNYPKAALRFPP